jgi:C4-dicarboxylate-specific signal transduction histidine kinase
LGTLASSWAASGPNPSICRDHKNRRKAGRKDGAVKSAELVFFGKVTASVTHELKNVFAIIKESGGLIEDLLAMGQESPILLKERLPRALSVIGTQVQRGVEITNRLNFFAHTTDEPLAKVDMNEMVENAVSLNRRLAKLRQVDLEAKTADEPVFLQSSPFLLQMAVHEAVRVCLGVLQPESRLEVSMRKVKDGRVAVGFLCEQGAASEEDRAESFDATRAWPRFMSVLEKMNGIVAVRESGDGFSLELGKCG